MPFVVRGPGVPAGRVVNEIGLNIDLASTFAEIAQVTPTVAQDGRSLVPLLTGTGAARLEAELPSRERQRGHHHHFHGGGCYTSSGSNWETLRHRLPRPGVERNPQRRGGNTSSGRLAERELYDLTADPFEMTQPPLRRRRHYGGTGTLDPVASAHDLRGPQLRDAGRSSRPLSHLPKGVGPE